MEKKQLGKLGPAVSAIGLGCMGMSGMYGPSDRAESLATIHAALDAGITLLDTGDFYGMGHNEMLIGEALRGVKRDSVVLSVKFGALRGPDMGWIGYDARPAAIKNFLSYSLQRLGVDHIDIYRPSRLDSAVPIEETIGAIADMVKAGYVRYIGLSEVGPETIKRAAATHPICDLQIEYSLLTRGIEQEILPTCRTLGIGITAYGVLSRGLISGHWQKEKAGKGDFRAFSPRFQGENVDKNLALVEALRRRSPMRKARPSPRSRSPGSPRKARISSRSLARGRASDSRSSLGALELTLTPKDLAAIEAAIPRGAASGERYPAQAMAQLDSERRH